MNEPLIPVDEPPLHAVAPAPPRPAPVKLSRATGLLGQALQCLPTLLILAILGTVGGLGYAYDWKLPKKLSELTGGKPDAEEDKTGCQQHPSIEADQCVHCNPTCAFRWPPDRDYGWCSEHGVFNCVLDHPDLAQLPQPPVVTPEERARIDKALKLLPRPESDKKTTVGLKRVQLASKETIEKLGLDFATAERQLVIESVSAPGEITYDPTRVARLASRAPGTVWRVLKQTGDPVKRGDVLVLVDSAEVGRAKTEFLQALVNFELKRTQLARWRKAESFVPEATLQQAETAEVEANYRMQSAEQALINLDLPIRAAR